MLRLAETLDLCARISDRHIEKWFDLRSRVQTALMCAEFASEEVPVTQEQAARIRESFEAGQLVKCELLLKLVRL